EGPRPGPKLSSAQTRMVMQGPGRHRSVLLPAAVGQHDSRAAVITTSASKCLGSAAPSAAPAARRTQSRGRWPTNRVDRLVDHKIGSCHRDPSS
ncbi:MAG: hypothetical protein LC776_08005, partial [Acidobacteria bacterium]|nr:hypothetical protein [Acidobacteriota bacterium]